MGDRSTLKKGSEAIFAAAVVPPARLIRCEQAIFTSIRTPTGEGYRVIATSAGVRGEEKVEITRRSPSHQSLCGKVGEAIGLSAYPLSGRRYAISWCGHAGAEHTARGGQRVYTHVAILDEAAFAEADYDPVRIHAAMGRWLARTGPVLKPPLQLAPLSLDLSEPFPETRFGLTGEEWEWAWAVAAQLLAGQKLILVGLSADLALLAMIVSVLPVGLRRSISVCCDLTYSPTRQMDLVLLPDADVQLRHRIVGQGIALHLLDAPPPVGGPAWADWFALLRSLASERQFTEIGRITAAACDDWSPDALTRLVSQWSQDE